MHVNVATYTLFWLLVFLGKSAISLNEIKSDFDIFIPFTIWNDLVLNHIHQKCIDRII